MTGKITLRGLARELGLHSSTVSRALSGHPAIDPVTARRVHETAQRLGYIPNPDVALAMRAIRRASKESLHGIFGVLNFFPTTAQGRRLLAALPQHHGVVERARQLGWVADTIHVHEAGMTWRSVRAILRARNIVGVIMLPPPLDGVPAELDVQGLHVVAASSAWMEVKGMETVTTVLPAHWRNALMLFEHLRAAGYRRPLLHVHERIEQRHLHATVAAYLYSQHEGFWESNIPVHSKALEKNAMRRVLDKHAPDVIVGPDVFVKDFLENDLGLRIPRDCAFIMYAHSAPGIAGIDQRLEIIGQSATEILTGMIIHGAPVEHEALRTMHVRGRIVPGATLPSRA